MIAGIPANVQQKGRELSAHGKIKIVENREVKQGVRQLKAKASCSFGFMHHPIIRVEETDGALLIRDFTCDCYEADGGNGFCSHSAALMTEFYGDAEAVVNRMPPTENELEGQEQLSNRYSFDKVHITETEEKEDGECLCTGKVYAGFGFVHYPKLRMKDGLLLEYTCDCYQNHMGRMCPHCEGLYAKWRLEKGQWKEAAEESGDEEPGAAEETEREASEEALWDFGEGWEDSERPLTMEILLGKNRESGKDVYWYPNDTSQVFHTNTGIIGTMGTGKTQFTKAMVTQLYRQQGNNFGGNRLGILIFDYKGDYNESKMDFVNAVNARVLKPHKLPFNPFSLADFKEKPQLPVHTANGFADTISRIYKLGPKQSSALLHCIIAAYKKRGILSPQRETWKYQAPTFHDVYEAYCENSEIKKNDSLYAAMDKLEQFEIFESNPAKTKSLYELLSGVVVIDLSGYDADIQSLIVAITLELFYSQMQNRGSSKVNRQYRQMTKFILVDEADNFMSEGFPALKKIMKEGREFGVGTILSTQFLQHFGSGAESYSRYIQTWAVHHVADLKKSDVEYVFHTGSAADDTERLFQDIKTLGKHQSIVKIGNSEKAVYLEDQAFWELLEEERYE